LRVFIILILIIDFAISCAICQLQTPSVKVDIDMQNREAFIEWKFTKEFSSEVIMGYDKDGDGSLIGAEFDACKKDLIEYLKDFNFLTEFKAYDRDNFDFKVDSYNFSITDGKLNLTYNLKFNLENIDVFSLVFEDKNEYFNFSIDRVRSFSKEGFNSSFNINKNIIFFEFKKSELIDSKNEKVENIVNRDKDEVKEVKVENDESFITLLSNKLATLTKEIKANLAEIKSSDSIFAVIPLLIFSFIYGTIHALGPGHGKALVSSYFLANNRSYLQAGVISLFIGVVHSFSAFILTFSIYYFIDVLLSKFMLDVEYFTTKISALVIMAIAILLFIKKFRAKKIVKWSTSLHTSSCGCASCKNDSSDIAVVFLAGVIPCAGTVTIFIFTLSQDMLFIGFLSAIFMSLGMSLIIFVSSIVAIYIKKRFNKTSSKYSLYLEYIALFCIFTLGFLLFFGL